MLLQEGHFFVWLVFSGSSGTFLHLISRRIHLHDPEDPVRTQNTRKNPRTREAFRRAAVEPGRVVKMEGFLVKMKHKCDRNNDRKWHPTTKCHNLLKLKEAGSVPDSLLIQTPPQVREKGRHRPRNVSGNDGRS